MKNIKQLSVILLLISVSLYFVWSEYLNRSKTDVIRIDNLTKEMALESKIPLKEGRYVHKVAVQVKGEVDGQFKVNGVIVEKGKIDQLIEKRDWYEPQYSIKFVPISSQNGAVVVYVTYYW